MIATISNLILRRKTLLLVAFSMIMSPFIIGKVRGITYDIEPDQTGYEKQIELTNLAIKFFGIDETYELTVKCSDAQFCDPTLNRSQRESIFKNQFFLSREFFDMSAEEQKSFRDTI